MAGKDTQKPRSGKSAPRTGKRRSGFLTYLTVFVVVAVVCSAGYKISTPHLQASEQAKRNAQFRQKIKVMRAENAAKREQLRILKTQAGSEAEARDNGWRKKNETGVLVPEEKPSKDLPALPDKGGKKTDTPTAHDGKG